MATLLNDKQVAESNSTPWLWELQKYMALVQQLEQASVPGDSVQCHWRYSSEKSDG